MQEAFLNLRVYIVEDDSQTAQMLRDILALSSYEVVGVAANATAAVLWLVSNPEAWDLVIIDYRLAAGTGLTVLAACRVRAAGQHAVMLTAHADGVLRRRCADLGADGVFDKGEGLGPLLALCDEWQRSSWRTRLSLRGQALLG